MEKLSESNPAKKHRIPLLKHYVPVWALLLTVLTIGSVMAVVVLNYAPIVVNVGEPLVLDQNTVTYNTVAGSTEIFILTVQNSANNAIPFTLAWSSDQAVFLTLTADGQALAQAGMDFTAPARISLTEPGSITIEIAATSSTSTAEGMITIQFTVTR